MKASRSRNISGSCNRGNFFELIVRCSKQLDKNVEFLQEFIDKYIKTVIDKSELVTQRLKIRANANINLILNENQVTLQKLF